MLLKKMLRDMSSKKTQFISIFIMAILGVLIFSGMNAEWYGMRQEVDKYYKDTRLADYWVKSSNFTNEDVNKVKNISGVKSVVRRLTLDSSLDLKDNPTLRINVIESNTLSSPLLVKGEALEIAGDGVWLDESFAGARGLKVGDKLKFDLNGLKLEKTILGLIMHPEYVHNVVDSNVLVPNHKTFGFAFLPSGAIPQEIKLPYNVLLIEKDGNIDSDSLKSAIEDTFSDRYHVVLDRDMQPSVVAFNSEIDQNKAMGGVFPVVFFLIAALAMLTTMTRMTNNQRTQIGILKALGFSKRKIIFHYVSYGIWIGLIGGIIGLIIGPLLIPPILFNMQKTIYSLPNWSIAIAPASFVSVAIAVLCCGASSFFACRQQMKEVPAATLRPKAPKVGKHTRLEKSKLWHRFSFSVQWNLRDLMRSRIRSIMAVVGVMGCSALLLFGLGLNDSVNGVSTWMYGDLNVYESKINLEQSVKDTEFADIKSKYSGQWIQESKVQIRFKDSNEGASLVVTSTGNQINFENENRQKISLPDDGIGMSYKMAKIIKADIGDTIEWRMMGNKEWVKSVIKVLYRTPMGQGIAMSENAYGKMGQTFKATALLSSEKSDNISKLAGIKSIQDKNQLIESFNGLLESMKMIIFILIIAAFFLGSVVLYNLGVLSFTERNRELATLKVLGFFSKQIRALLLQQNIWLTIAGIIGGLPVGYFLVKFMLSTMSEETDMITQINPLSWILSIAATFLLSVIVNLVLSMKVKHIDMVSSLKSVE